MQNQDAIVEKTLTGLVNDGVGPHIKQERWRSLKGTDSILMKVETMVAGKDKMHGYFLEKQEI